jgi:hypothetical protein
MRCEIKVMVEAPTVNQTYYPVVVDTKTPMPYDTLRVHIRIII